METEKEAWTAPKLERSSIAKLTRDAWDDCVDAGPLDEECQKDS